MRSRKTKEEESQCDAFLGHLGAWEGEGETAESGSNILKQFKKNLHNYERTYQDHKHSQLAQHSRVRPNADKENEVRLTLPSLSQQQKKQTDYSQFLESQLIKGVSKVRQSSIIHYKQSKGNPFKAKSRSRCESFVEFYRSSAQPSLQDMFLKKHRGFSISRTLKYSKMKERKNSTQLLVLQGREELEGKLSVQLPSQ